MGGGAVSRTNQRGGGAARVPGSPAGEACPQRGTGGVWGPGARTSHGRACSAAAGVAGGARGRRGPCARGVTGFLWRGRRLLTEDPAFCSSSSPKEALGPEHKETLWVIPAHVPVTGERTHVSSERSHGGAA